MLYQNHKYSPKAWIALGLLAVGCVSFSVPSFAQSVRDLDNRLSRLENEIGTLSRAMFRGEDPPPGSFSGGGQAAANVEVRIQQLEGELQSLRGLIEEQGFQVRQMKADLERSMSDFDLRLNDLQGGGAASSNGASSSVYNKRPIDGAEPSAGNDGYSWSSNNASKPGQLGTYMQSADTGEVIGSDNGITGEYESALAKLKGRDYAGAEAAFTAFIGSHPDNDLTGNVKYWLGETYYVQGKHEQAARLFAEGYQQFPKGNKAADNLLKLGMSLAAMGKKEDACVALGQIAKEGFVNAGPVIRRADQEKARLGC